MRIRTITEMKDYDDVMGYIDEPEERVTASKVIKREHELLGEEMKPSKKEQRVHRTLRKEFDDEDDYDDVGLDTGFMGMDYKFKMDNSYYDKPIRMPDFDFPLGGQKRVKPKRTRDVIKKGVKTFKGVNY